MRYALANGASTICCDLTLMKPGRRFAMSMPSGADHSLLVLREFVTDRATLINIGRTGDVSDVQRLSGFLDAGSGVGDSPTHNTRLVEVFSRSPTEGLHAEAIVTPRARAAASRTWTAPR